MPGPISRPLLMPTFDTGKSPRDTLRSIGNVVISAAVENSLSDIDKSVGVSNRLAELEQLSKSRIW